MPVISISEQELLPKFLEACKIIQNMRGHKRKAEAMNDPAAMAMAKRWERKADKFIESLNIEEDGLPTGERFKNG